MTFEEWLSNKITETEKTKQRYHTKSIAIIELMLLKEVEKAWQAALQSQWQPIETAPKDGAWILAINAKNNRYRQHVVHYSERHSKNTDYVWVTDSAPMSWVAGLTHWQPLPQPPSV